MSSQKKSNFLGSLQNRGFFCVGDCRVCLDILKENGIRMKRWETVYGVEKECERKR